MTTLEASEIKLRFVPLGQLLLHEEDDPFRVTRLVQAFSRDKRLRNPPIVSCHGDQYVVLDGATRISALQEMQYRDALVQIVNYSAETVSLNVWHHVIVGMSPNRLLANLADVDEVTLQPVDAESARQKLASREIVACIIMRNGREFAVLCEGNINRQANLLCKLVKVYRGKAEVHRTTTMELSTLSHEYPDLSALIAFPAFHPEEIVQIAEHGDKLPMGITRHLIAGRALSLNVSLDMMTGARTLEEKNAWLEKQIRQRLRTNKIRLYQEPVFVFDE